jgi:hypothetical protein
MKKRTAALIMLYFLAGCSEQTETVSITAGNPTAAEVLELDSAADMFQLDGVIYQTNVEWVDQLSLSKGEKVGEIQQTVTVPENFRDGDATRLAKGTVIFQAVEQQEVLIVDVNGEEQYYLALLEG